MKSIINEFKPSGGKHCITHALKQVFQYYNKPLSEEMIFGIGCGLGFTYINLANSPMISGRTKPFIFEENIANRLDIKIKCRTTKIYDKAFNRTKELISTNNPVIIYADMPYLNYLNLDEDNHFGGHAIVLFGFDDNNNSFYVSDRDNSNYPIRTPKGLISEDFHLVDYSQLEKARSSNHRPFPANNKWLEFDFTNYHKISLDIVLDAIKETCESMLNPPAKLLGVNGINKFSKEVMKWSKFNKEKIKLAGITNYFMISADGGTGGGIFRDIYGRFLIEASEKFNISELKLCGDDYILIGQKWDKIATLLWVLSENGDINILKEISELADEIYDNEVATLNRLFKITL